MNRKGMTLFLALGLMWGTSFVLIREGLYSYSPAQLVGLRILSGFLVLLPVAVLRGERIGFGGMPKRVVGAVVVSALASFILPYYLIAWGEVRATTSLVGVLNSTTPIFTAVISPFLIRNVRLGRSTTLGVLIGILGVAIIFHPWSSVASRSSEVAGVAILGASALYGLGMVIQKAVLLPHGMSPLRIAANQLGIVSILVLLFDFHLFARLGTASPANTVAVVLLGAFNTGVTALLLLNLSKLSAPTMTAGVTYLIALVSVVEGVVLLGDTLSTGFVLGALVTLGGLAVMGLGSLSARSDAVGVKAHPSKKRLPD